MNFSINKKELQEALVEHCKVVPIRSTLPILSCALFSLNKNGLKIKTTDLEQTIISQQKTKGDEKGSFAVPISKLLEIVTALTDSEISFSINDDFLIEINTTQGVYKITGKTPDDFPETPNTETTNNIEVEGVLFNNIVEKTGYAASKDDLKPALCGVLFLFDNNKITTVATDGHKLVKHEEKTKDNTNKETSIVLPLKFLNIVKNLSRSTKTIKITIGDNHVQTEQKNFTVISRTIKEAFPDFNSVIPENNKTKIEVETEKLQGCLRRVSIFANRTTKQTILSFSSKGITLSSQDIESSTSAKEHIDCVFEGEEVTASYNAKYLSEVIKHLNTKKTKIYLNSALTAAVFKPNKEEEKTTALLMPIRINQ